MFEAIKEIIVEVAGCDEDQVTMEAVLEDDLGLDSLDAVQVNMEIEEKLGVAIPDEELANLKSVGDIVNYVESHK